MITQNIDGLHQKAGSNHVLELHGSVYRNFCMDCGEKYSIEEVAKVKGVPHCRKCNGIIKPDVVLYGEALNAETIEEAVQKIAEADMLIVGGTSLDVYPAAGLIDYYTGERLDVYKRQVLEMKRSSQYGRQICFLLSSINIKKRSRGGWSRKKIS